MDILVRVIEIRGHCPVYEKGSSFVLEDGYRLVSEKPLCMHSLASILPFYNALRFASPQEMGISRKDKEDKACVQCPDPVDCTGGGTVIFEIERTESRK